MNFLTKSLWTPVVILFLLLLGASATIIIISKRNPPEEVPLEHLEKKENPESK